MDKGYIPCERIQTLPACKSLALVAASLAWLTVAPQDAFAAKGFKLIQNSDYYGEQVTVVTPRFIKVSAPGYGVTLAMNAPDFKVTAVNDQTKTFSVLTYDTWQNQILNMKQRTRHPDCVKRTGGTIAGMKTMEYFVQDGSRRGQFKKHPHMSVGAKTYNTQLFTTDEIKVPTQFLDVFTVAAEMPNNVGFPLRLVKFSPTGKQTVTYNTRRVERTEVAEKFAVPKGYKRATDEMAVFFGDTSEISDLLGQPSGGKKLPTKSNVRAGWYPGGPSSISEGHAPSRELDGVTIKKKPGGWTP